MHAVDARTLVARVGRCRTRILERALAGFRVADVGRAETLIVACLAVVASAMLDVTAVGGAEIGIITVDWHIPTLPGQRLDTFISRAGIGDTFRIQVAGGDAFHGLVDAADDGIAGVDGAGDAIITVLVWDVHTTNPQDARVCRADIVVVAQNGNWNAHARERVADGIRAHVLRETLWSVRACAIRTADVVRANVIIAADVCLGDHAVRGVRLFVHVA
jgi:hypothetical protein